ncbi:MAG TPA: hypothetical protein VIY68_05375 [Steroidobacteraceae bacterium]
MKAIGTRLALQAALILVFLGPAMPLHAQQQNIAGSLLFVCNKGTVPVELVAAIRKWDVLRGSKYYWEINGTTMAPQECSYVKNLEGTPSYIAFGFTDSKGEWGSGSIAQVPDLGSVQKTLLGKLEKILTGATKAMCARTDANYYAMNDDFSTDCATLKLSGGQDAGHGPFLPLASALYFYPSAQLCDPQRACEWTHYYLNIFPSATDRELHATRGTKSDADAATQSSSSGASQSSGGAGSSQSNGDASPGLCGWVSCSVLGDLRKGVQDAEAQRTQRLAQEQADAAAQAQASLGSNVCVPDDLLAQWRNPPTGSKMEALQRELKASLRERAKSPRYDQSKWMTVDSSIYSTWNPAGPFRGVVTATDGGSCAVGHREFFALSP